MSAQVSLFCPQLGLNDDSHSVQSAASEDHRCYATGDATLISLDHQRRFCLAREHRQCPIYLRAKPQPPEPKRVIFSPEAVNPILAMDAGEGDAPSPAPPRWLDRAIVFITLAAILFAVVYFGALALGTPISLPSAASAPTRAISPTPSATRTATATSTPRPVSTATLSRPAQAGLTPPPGGQVIAINPLVDGGGWVSSGERVGNHLGDRLIQVGFFDRNIYLGLLQFDVSNIAAGTKLVNATLELAGAQDERLSRAGTWQIKLVNLPANKRWSALTFADVRDLPWDYVVQPPLTGDQLGKGRTNRLELSGPLLAAIERQFGQGKVTFRIEGPTGGEDDLFAWENGVGGGGAKPALYLATEAAPEQATKLEVIPCVPTPADPQQRAALAATATYAATVFGTPTPYPPNYVTPVVVTATPTPETIFAAATAAAEATLQAMRVGTATPTPVNWVVPAVITPTPEPANQATATYRAAYATAIAATTGTPTPLPCYVVVATATPKPSPTPVVVYDLPTATPTAEPTTTPTAIAETLRGKIAFMTDRDGAPAVYVMDPDGTRLGRLTHRWAYDWAATQQTRNGDGAQRLAVLGNLATGTRIVLFGAGDAQARVLFENSMVNYDPVFAPNGYDIAFVSTLTGHDEIYRMNRDGGGFSQLTTSVWEWNKRPTWSPDGARIAWWSNRETGRKQIWVMNADGTQAVNISRNEFNDWDPVWFR